MPGPRSASAANSRRPPTKPHKPAPPPSTSPPPVPANARQLNPAEAEARAWDSLARQDLGDITDVSVSATTQRIVVTIDSEIDTGLLGIFANDDEPFRISVTAIGTPREGTP